MPRIPLVRVALLATGLAACDVTGLDTRVTGREPFSPPEAFSEWWLATESCLGETGDLEAIEWYLATAIAADGLHIFGLWLPPHQIILVKGFQADPFTVRHEMLHDLLRGDSQHTGDAWTVCNLLTER